MSKRIYWNEFFLKMTKQELQEFCRKNEGKRPKWFNLKYWDFFKGLLSDNPVIAKHLVIADVGSEFWDNVKKFAIPLRIKRPLFSFFSRSYKKLINLANSIEKEHGKIVFVIIPEDEFSNIGFSVDPIAIKDLSKSEEQIVSEWLPSNEPRKLSYEIRGSMLRGAYLIKTGRVDTK